MAAQSGDQRRIAAAPTFTERQRLTLARLEAFPTWALEEAIARRRFKTHDAVIRLPGLLVDPVNARVEFRGVRYTVTGRPMELVFALAVARLQGHWRVPVRVLAAKLYRNFDPPAGRINVREYASVVNTRLVPGLILPSGNQRLGLGLAVRLPEPEGAP